MCRHYGPSATKDDLAKDVHSQVSVSYLNEVSLEPNVDEKNPRSSLIQLAKMWLARSVFGSAFVPDVTIGTWRASRKKSLAVATKVAPDIVLSSSPAHSVHDLGGWIAAKLGVPWIADFRDPYLIDSRYAPKGIGRLFLSRHRDFEKSIYQKAALITHAIPVQARWARRVYPWARERIQVIPNGVPDELIQMVAERDKSQVASASRPRRVSVVGGSFSATLVAQLAEAVGMSGGQDGDVKLEFVGPSPPEKVAALPWVYNAGWVSHSKALEKIANSDVLVALLDEKRSSAQVLSSKLFEYLAVARPVIVVNPSGPDRHYLSQFDGVQMLGLETGIAVCSTSLTRVLSMALRFDSESLRSQGAEMVSNYSRESQVCKLSSHMYGLVR
jgi:glycosyltransferase involved in cell wall biosynthesis